MNNYIIYYRIVGQSDQEECVHRCVAVNWIRAINYLLEEAIASDEIVEAISRVGVMDTGEDTDD